jgi:hypothetical protein
LLIWSVAIVAIVFLVLRKASTAKELADLITALASLAWPIVAVAIVSSFRPEFRDILARLKKGKLLGTEFELDKLESETQAAEVKQSPMTGTLSDTESGGDAFEAAVTVGSRTADDEIEEVLREAARSPTLGLMLLSAKINRARREHGEVAEFKLDDGSVFRMVRIPLEVARPLAFFNQARNQIVHGDDADEQSVARAIDSGTRLLRLLLSQPLIAPEDRPE